MLLFYVLGLDMSHVTLIKGTTASCSELCASCKLHLICFISNAVLEKPVEGSQNFEGVA